MPSDWHLAKQLASVLRLEVIEDAAVSHFHVLIYSLRQSARLLLFGISSAIRESTGADLS
jgi:hypothetical protein